MSGIPPHPPRAREPRCPTLGAPLVRGIVVAATLAAAVAGPGASPASAQRDRRDSEARNLFEAGRLAMEDGRFEDALDYFQRAYELSGRPALLYNVATVAERLGRDEVALDALERYLAERPEADDRRAIERRIELLRERLASAPATAPTPAETAAAGAASDGQSDPLGLSAEPASTRDQGGDDRLVTKWWFWTVVGAVVVGGAVTAGVLVSRDDPGERGPIPGSNGSVVFALGER